MKLITEKKLLVAETREEFDILCTVTGMSYQYQNVVVDAKTDVVSTLYYGHSNGLQVQYLSTPAPK